MKAISIMCLANDSWLLACRPALVNNLTVFSDNLTVNDDRFWKAGSVEVSVNFRSDNACPIAISHVKSFESDLCVEDFAIAPRFDRCRAAKFVAGVVAQSPAKVAL